MFAIETKGKREISPRPRQTGAHKAGGAALTIAVVAAASAEVGDAKR